MSILLRSIYYENKESQQKIKKIGRLQHIYLALLKHLDSNVFFSLLTLSPTVDPYIVSEVAPCLGCPENIENHEDLREPLMHSLAKANSILHHMHFFIFKDLSSATKQVSVFFSHA